MAQFFINRPIFAWVISIVIMLAGGLSIYTLPLEQCCPQAFAFDMLVSLGEHFERKTHAGNRRAQFVGNAAGEFAMRGE